jgi:hypothetical protein
MLPLAPGNRGWGVLDERVEAAELSFLLKTLGMLDTKLNK